MRPKLLIVICDAYLAGIYGRKFERDGFDVEVSESFVEGERLAERHKPDAMIVDIDCIASIEEMVKMLRSRPVHIDMKILLFGSNQTREQIQKALPLIDGYLLQGHFIPQEAVKKVRALLAA